MISPDSRQTYWCDATEFAVEFNVTFAPVRTADGVPSSVTFVSVGTCEEDVEFAPKSVSVMEDGTKVSLNPGVESAEIIPNSDPDVKSWEADLLDVTEVSVKLNP